jgi:tRNA (guanine9-N1)-methyltransferase
MHSQLMFMYSANRTAKRPFANILHTSFAPTPSPRLWKSMENMNWQRWSRSLWWAEGVDTLGRVMSEGGTVAEADEKIEEVRAEASGSDLASFLSGPRLPPSWQGHKLIYLSADAEEELETLSEDEVYVIGGLVDRNRHKVRRQVNLFTLI